VIQPIAGLAVLIALTWAWSEKRRHVAWRDIVVGLALQFAVALILLRFPPARRVFAVLNQGVILLEEATRAATILLFFGYLGGAPCPFCGKRARCRPLSSDSRPSPSVPGHQRSLLPAVLLAHSPLSGVRILSWRAARKPCGIGRGRGGAERGGQYLPRHVEAPLIVRSRYPQHPRSE
jgi:CNT family concentrative nucleoside transporter